MADSNKRGDATADDEATVLSRKKSPAAREQKRAVGIVAQRTSRTKSGTDPSLATQRKLACRFPCVCQRLAQDVDVALCFFIHLSGTGDERFVTVYTVSTTQTIAEPVSFEIAL